MTKLEKKDYKEIKILYVDDSEVNLILFQATFNQEYHVLIADSGPKGLEIMRNNDIAVIVSDQRMPEMTGTELLEIVSKEFPDTLRFIFTALTDYDTVVESVNRGQIYGFFNKPLDVDGARRAINKAIEVYEFRRQRVEFLEKVEKVNQELLDMDKSRTKFLNAITKEFRAPLQEITSALHMLKNKAESKDLAELINFLDTSVGKLESFTLTTNHLVDLRSKSEGIDAKSILLREIIEICIIDLKSLLTEREISIKLEGIDSEVKILGEENYILHALALIINRLTEALKEKKSLNFKISVEEDSIFLDLEFTAFNFHENNIQWITFFSQSDMEHYESNIEQIFVMEVMQAHKGRIEIVNSDEKSILVRLIFPVHFDR